jgi:hypothetical protein
MKTTLRNLALAASLTAMLSGCAGVMGPSTGARKSALSSSEKPQCKPSQYWDGQMCRHKGKGHGARKHDG